LVVDHLRENGGLRIAQEAARRLPVEGLPATLFVLQRTEPGPGILEPAADVDVIVSGHRPEHLRTALPRAFLGLLRATRRSSVLVATSEVGYNVLITWLVARLFRRPFVVLVQSELAPSLEAWVPGPLHGPTKWVLARVDLAVCVSAGLVPGVLDVGTPGERVAVLQVGIDVDAVRAAAAVGPPLSADGPYVVAMGRLSAEKGFDVLLRAFAHAAPDMAGWSLVVVGDGPDRDQLQTLAKDLGIADRVRLTGYLPQPQAVLAGGSLFVLSSRREGMGGLVLLEALAHGMPIVATDCMAGPREILRDGELGRLVEVDDVSGLAAALAAHAADPAVLEKAAVGGPERAREFAPPRWVPQLAELLSTVDEARRKVERPRKYL
jgi:glycosyltransferase involved in cell wall biosynthesis